MPRKQAPPGVYDDRPRKQQLPVPLTEERLVQILEAWLDQFYRPINLFEEVVSNRLERIERRLDEQIGAIGTLNQQLTVPPTWRDILWAIVHLVNRHTNRARSRSSRFKSTKRGIPANFPFGRR